MPPNPTLPPIVLRCADCNHRVLWSRGGTWSHQAPQPKHHKPTVDWPTPVLRGEA